MSESIEPGSAVLMPTNETSVAAVAAQAKASVEARFLVAYKKPRDILQFRDALLKECERPFFAEVARYAKPVAGRKIEGPSIRFVETALRCFGNVLRETPTIYEDDEKLIIRVLVTDLEANVTHQTDVRVQKTVERSKPSSDREVLGQRLNSQGKPVYILKATDDELLNKTNALISKAVRNMGLCVLPGDVVEEAQQKCLGTRRKADSADPDAARKRIADAFSPLGVEPSHLADYLGHPLAQSSPAELEDLRAIHSAIKEGETTWSEVVRQRQTQTDDKNAAERDRDTLDEVDIAKVRATLKNQAKRHKMDDPSPIEADVLADFETGEVRELTTVPKAELPSLLKAIIAWEPKKAAPEPQQAALA